MADLKMSVENCAKKLADAQEAYDQADAAYQAASRERADRTNILNAAQKAMDAAVDELRSAAPWGSDWHSKRERGLKIAG
jgi:hypothetical protein